MVNQNIDVDCPSCKSKLSVKVPDTNTASSDQMLGDDIAERLAKIESKTQALPEDFCTKFPELCQNMNGIKADVADIKARQTEQAEAAEHSHYAPTEELFDHWLNCPGCKTKADDLAKRLAERSKAKEPVVVPEKPSDNIETAIVPATEAESNIESIPEPAEDESVWNRVMG
ncbi:hypothetical protein Dehly_0049 [Dehalogenimonas lykanthroporepellens BL-DC-9]|nr:hypothetical protein Dehly_0049 [Dehalogenimonas lykanthroporepellens BL-DC-9]